MDNPKHEQKQRIESQHRTEDASERVVCTRRKGDGSRSQEQDGALKPDCERGNHHGQIDGLHGAREVVVGGIMRQVSELEQRHLAYVYAHRDRLQKRLKENLEEEVGFMADSKAIKEQLQQMMDKN